MTALDQESGADRANGSGVGRRGFLSLGGGGVLAGTGLLSRPGARPGARPAAEP